jgi:PPP family 3-phenylpropionic acid transporter
MKINEANRLRILYFLIFSCTAAWLPIFADYLKDHGLSGMKIGIILSVTPLMMFLIQPVYGIFADHIGYKKCLLFSAFFASISYVFYLFSGGFAYLLVVTVSMSFFYNSIQPLLDSLTLTFIQKNPSFSYGKLRIAGAAGWACTGILTGYFIDKLDTTVIFVFSAVSMLFTFFLAFTLHTIRPAISPSNNISIKHDLKEILRNKKLMFLLCCVFLIYAASSPIYYFYSIYMKENGASSSLIGFAISLQGLCELPLFYFSARIIARLGIKTTLLVSIFATAVRMLLYSFVKNPQLAVLIELLHGIAWSLFWVACVEQVNVLVKEQYRATGQSFLSASLLGAGAIAGNLWTGFLYDSQMRVADIYMLNAGIVSAIGVFILVIMRPSVSGTNR